MDGLLLFFIMMLGAVIILGVWLFYSGQFKDTSESSEEKRNLAK